MRTADRRAMPPPLCFANRLFRVILMLPAFAGCGMPAVLVGRYEAAATTLVASKVESLSPVASDIVFALAVHNPNSYGLRMRLIRYRLMVHGVAVAEGTNRAEVSLPAGKSTTWELPVSVRVDALEAAAPEALGIGEVPYQLEGWVSLGSWLRQREMHFIVASTLRFSLPLELADQRARGCDGDRHSRSGRGYGFQPG